MNQPISISHGLSLQSGAMTGPEVRESVKKLHDLCAMFQDSEAAAAMDPATVVYRVQYWMPVEEGTPGGLFWGTTTIQPGKIGTEYFMTHGHLHVKADRAEYYATVQGEGALILMEAASGRVWAEAMHPGSLHYIAGGVAHRVANTGREPLVFTACWPSDAGHDYKLIREHGFSARLREVGGKPELVMEAAGESARG